MVKARRVDWVSAPEVYRAFRRAGMFPDPLWRRARDGIARLHFERMIVAPKYRPLEGEVTDDGVVPEWFWERSGRPPTRDNWLSGDLIRAGRFQGRDVEVRLYGFGFDAAAVRKLVPLDLSFRRDEKVSPNRKRLHSLTLQNWFDALVENCGGVDNLPPLDVIWEAAQARYPDKFISRDAIRAIVPRRKPGPKPIRDNRTA